MTSKKSKQACPVVAAGIEYIDYKDTVFLKQFLTKFNRIIPRQYSHTTLKNQKKIATAIKRARYMALLPYVVDPRHTTSPERPKVEATTNNEIDTEAVAI